MKKARTKRNILSGRKICKTDSLKWPKIEDEVELEIKDIIKRIFKKYKSCMRTLSKQQDSKDGRPAELTEDDLKQRKTFRSMFVIGFNAVIRKLERGQLRFVLMSKDTQPAILRRTVLSMAIQQGCPSVAVSDLLTPISESWEGLKSATCLGILECEGKNDFDELISYIKNKNVPLPESITPSIERNKLKEVNKSIGGKDAGKEDEELERAKMTRNVQTTQIKSTPKPVRPVIDFTKYYKPVNMVQQQKKFEGQSFIAFTDDACDEVIVFKDGMRVTTELDRNMESCGIKTFVTDKVSSEPSKGVKRKHYERVKSNYKSINIQQLKPNVNKVKKMKRK